MQIIEIVPVIVAIGLLGLWLWLYKRQVAPAIAAEKARNDAATRFFNAAADEMEGN